MRRGLLVLLAAVLGSLWERSQVEACSCGPAHPQQHVCHSDVVVKGKVVSSELISGDNSQWIRYELQQQKVFKGLEKMNPVQYVYSPYTDYLCGLVIQPENLNEDYLLSGNIDSDGRLYVTLCGFNKPWAEVTAAQKMGLNGTYEASCECAIISCHALPCSLTADDQCLWTDGLFFRDWAGTQAKRFACQPRQSGLCHWEALKARSSKRSARAKRH
ncbi:metalloproteinase inhibitor 4-like [Hemitrygon akajei]|uniref:metalloproteinase inhibitor 4-like n=1 Tax=Hemitrygon akajei TaxID=2704970 RepID=UPI003BF9DB22